MAPTTAARIREELLRALPGLATHFELGLIGMQPPQFLLYREGDFFRPHHDDSTEPDAPDFVRQRSVSAVVFVNGSAEPTAYSGGSLTFYGLMDEGVTGESVGLPLAGETGLLVAFPSHLVHAVSPVTAGERYTVVTWFFEGPEHHRCRSARRRRRSARLRPSAQLIGIIRGRLRFNRGRAGESVGG